MGRKNTTKSKKQLLRTIRKETMPQKGFGQWILVLEHRRVSENLGLLLAEAQLNGRSEWSGSMSVNLPEQKKYGPDGNEVQSEWEALALGQSRYNVFTFEMRGKSVFEIAKAFVKRSFEEGKIQDIVPWSKS